MTGTVIQSRLIKAAELHGHDAELVGADAVRVVEYTYDRDGNEFSESKVIASMGAMRAFLGY